MLTMLWRYVQQTGHHGQHHGHHHHSTATTGTGGGATAGGMVGQVKSHIPGTTVRCLAFLGHML